MFTKVVVCCNHKMFIIATSRSRQPLMQIHFEMVDFMIFTAVTTYMYFHTYVF